MALKTKKNNSKTTKGNKKRLNNTAKKGTKKSANKKAATTKASKKSTKKNIKSNAEKNKKSLSKKSFEKKNNSELKNKKDKILLEIFNLSKDIPSEKYFILANGKPVKNVIELAKIMDDLEDHIFNHHVNNERNDFYNWIKDVFEDVALAKKVLGIDNKKDLQLVIYKHITHKLMDKK